MPHLSYSDGWTVVPRGIYFTHLEASSSAVNFYDFDSHRTRLVRSLPGAPTPLGGLGISVSQDEHWLLYTRTTQWQGDIMMLSGLDQER
jgi:hypothetical protein